MKSIYLISTKSRSKRGKYKLGKHTGSEKQLLSRYTTSLINPIIFFFRPVGDADKIENVLKERLLKYRIRNHKGTVLEWVRWEFKKIVAIIKQVIDKYDDSGINKSMCYRPSKTQLHVVCSSGAGSDEFPKDVNKYICKKCNLSFDLKGTYDNHMKRSTDCSVRIHGNVGKVRGETNVPTVHICNCCDPEKEFDLYKYDRHCKTKKHIKNSKSERGDTYSSKKPTSNKKYDDNSSKSEECAHCNKKDNLTSKVVNKKSKSNKKYEDSDSEEYANSNKKKRPDSKVVNKKKSVLDKSSRNTGEFYGNSDVDESSDEICGDTSESSDKSCANSSATGSSDDTDEFCYNSDEFCCDPSDTEGTSSSLKKFRCDFSNTDETSDTEFVNNTPKPGIQNTQVFACKKCGVSFSSKATLETHMSRLTDCTIKVHGNFGKKRNEPNVQVVHVCKYCDPAKQFNFFNYTRHCNTKKHCKNVEKCNNRTVINSENVNINKSVNNACQNVNNAHRDIIHNNNCVTTTNNIHFNVEPKVRPHLFTYYDISDLSLFEQYCVLTYNIERECSPYTTILGQLNLNANKPKYNNIKHRDNFRPIIEVYTGSKFTESDSELIEDFIASERELFCQIFNKFRFFLSRKASVFSNRYLYEGLQTSSQYFRNKQKIKKYIKNKPPNSIPAYSDEKIPNKKDPIWNSLSKYFDWKQVAKYIDYMEIIGIDFNKNAARIKTTVEEYVAKNPTRKGVFELLIKRLDYIVLKDAQICYLRVDNNANTSGDEMEKPPKEPGLLIEPNLGVKKDDHVSYVSRNSYFGAASSGKKFGSLAEIATDKSPPIVPNYSAFIPLDSESSEKKKSGKKTKPSKKTDKKKKSTKK